MWCDSFDGDLPKLTPGAPDAVGQAANIVRLIFSPVYGLMAVPPCPHEGCGWFMPDLSCPAHGNYGMTYLSVRRGPVTRVKAVLGIPQEQVPDEEVRAAIAEHDRRLAATREAAS